VNVIADDSIDFAAMARIRDESHRKEGESVLTYMEKHLSVACSCKWKLVNGMPCRHIAAVVKSMGSKYRFFCLPYYAAVAEYWINPTLERDTVKDMSAWRTWLMAFIKRSQRVSTVPSTESILLDCVSKITTQRSVSYHLIRAQ
jgi:hypothetical protein